MMHNDVQSSRPKRWGPASLFLLLSLFIVSACGTMEAPAALETPENIEAELELQNSKYSLRGNPSFSASQLSSEQRKWYDTLWKTINNPNQHPNAISLAKKGDIYEYGRHLQNYVTSLLIAFRMTGDLRLLDQVDKIMELMRSQLSDGWTGTLDGKDGTKDGFLNWVDKHSSSKEHRGKDLQAAFDMKTHALVAYAAWAFQNNRDLRSPSGVNYGARADFWRGYLVDHFEAKWRKRFNNPSSFPFIPNSRVDGVHTYTSALRYFYYMGKLTGRSAYTAEAQKMAGVLWSKEFVETSSKDGTALVWRKGVASLGSKQNYLMSGNYARYVVSDVVDFHLEGFDKFASASNMQKFARALTGFVMDSTSLTSFARDIGGGTSRSGIPASSTTWKRLDQYGLTEAPWPFLTAWDGSSSGKLKKTFEQLFYDVEMQKYNRTPRRVFVPTGMLINAFLR